MGDAIVLAGLVHRYGDRSVLAGLDLEVRAGEWMLLLGSNGAGKTTTTRILMGLLAPDAGRATIGGLDVRRAADALRRRVGYLPEQGRPYPFLSGREYLGFVADMHAVPRAEVRGRVGELLELLDLGTHADAPIGRYSLGLARKLGLAAALLPRPSVLVLDEPTANLDASSAHRVREVLGALAQAGTTILMSTHILGLVEKQCHRLAILHRGRVELVATPAELEARYPGQTLEQVLLGLTGEIGAGSKPIDRFVAGWRG